MWPSPGTQGISAEAGAGGADPGWSASFYIWAFTSALILAMLIFASAIGYYYVAGEMNRAIDRAGSFAREFSASLDKEIVGRQMALTVAAASPALQTDDLPGFQQRAIGLAHVLRMDIVLRPVGSRRAVVSRPHSRTDQVNWEEVPEMSSERTVEATGKPATSNLFGQSPDRANELAVTVPVRVRGEIRYLLSGVSSAQDLVAGSVPARLEAGWYSALIDASGIIIARTGASPSLVGRAVPPAWRLNTPGDAGIWYGVNLQEVPVVSAYIRSPTTGWTSTVTMPDEILRLPSRSTILLILGGGALMFAMGAAMAFWTAGRLVKSINALKRIGSLAAGGHAEDIRTPIAEINDVGRILKASVQELAERHAEHQAILDTVPSAMVMIDRDGIVMSFSKTAESMFGYSPAEVVGRNVNMLMPEPERSQHDHALQLYRLEGEQHVVGKARTLRGLRKDGSIFFHELYVGTAPAHGDLVFVGFMYDLTDRLRVEAELRQAQRMEALGKLTGGVAHDFNNLLTVIQGNLEMLRERVRGPVRRMVQDAEEAVDIANQVTANLLSFGRRTALRPVTQEVGPVVRWTFDLLSRTLGDRIDVGTEIEEGLYAHIDGAQLRNALINLAINARDAMPRGGRITASVRSAGLQDFQGGSPGLPAGDYVAIGVADTGDGMTAEVRERAADPFFTTKPPGLGSGLGLSSVYGFARQSGGTLSIDSEPGRGSCITIYLPRLPAAAAEAVERYGTRPRPVHAEQAKILLVEDDARVRRLAATWLSRIGYQVVAASSGREALKLLERHPDVSLLFTDLVMPGDMDGLALAIHARVLMPDLPVVMTSGHELSEFSASIPQPLLLLQKPYSRAKLARAVAELLAKGVEDPQAG